MFGSYIKIALRMLIKNKLYAAINVAGLAIGLAVYILSGLITDYERNHDSMFTNSENIFSISSVQNPLTNPGSVETTGVYMALQPIMKLQLPELTGVSRGLNFETLLKNGDVGFYQDVKFVDPDFTSIFNFTYLHGSADSLNGPSQIILTKSKAYKFFGREDVVGETLILSATSGEFPQKVVAVIDDIAVNSHFNSSLMEASELGVIGLTDTITLFFKDLDHNNNWGWLNTGYFSYVMTDGSISQPELEQKINNVFHGARQTDEPPFVTSLKVRPLSHANLAIWYGIGMPVMDVLEYLGVLVLLIAIINYTNLATAQNMGRFREVGLRKTLGADRKQLLIQFITECQSIVLIAAILSLTLVEIAIPIFNSSLGKALVLDYAEMTPWLIITVLSVGLLAGSYPAFMITRTSTYEAINNSVQKSKGGALFRNAMIGSQFIISIVMMALVFVISAQNNQVVRDSEIFPKSQVMTLQRIENTKILNRLDTLHREVTALNDVENAAFSSQVPFVQQNWGWNVTREKGDANNKVRMNNMLASSDFFETFDIPMIAGRNFIHKNGSPPRDPNVRQDNVIINEMAAKALGFTTAEDAVGNAFFVGENNPFQLNIIGVMADRNILGVQNRAKPFAVRNQKDNFRHMSIRLKAGASIDTVSQIEEIWGKINPEFPIDWDFLDVQFEEQFKIMRMVNVIFTGFASLALLLALFGLFGLAAFMAEQRTKEIGIRKVLGAKASNIVTMLIFQFSKPVIFAIMVAVPLAYMAADEYLNYFAEKIGFVTPLILLASGVAVLLSWSIIAVHAVKVANETPIKALRAE